MAQVHVAAAHNLTRRYKILMRVLELYADPNSPQHPQQNIVCFSRGHCPLLYVSEPEFNTMHLASLWFFSSFCVACSGLQGSSWASSSANGSCTGARTCKLGWNGRCKNHVLPGIMEVEHFPLDDHFPLYKQVVF